jgi:mRNA-degrading endonuclease toxin of MazEF toxin-antitoxin module
MAGTSPAMTREPLYKRLWRTPSAALADQVKSLDWRARKAKKKGAATKAEVAQALAKARTLLQ